jgi:hypothetical protein
MQAAKTTPVVASSPRVIKASFMIYLHWAKIGAHDRVRSIVRITASQRWQPLHLNHGAGCFRLSSLREAALLTRNASLLLGR